MTEQWDASPEPLSTERIEYELRGLPNWHLTEDAIAREYVFAEEADADHFLDRVGDLGRELNHDPEVDRDGNTLRLVLTTHDTGGVSDRDIKLARLIQALPEDRSGS